MKRIEAVFLACLLALFAGCGFQLRGEAQLPFEQAYVKASENSRIARLLREALDAQGKLAQEAKGAPVVIGVSNEQFKKDILSLSGGGKVREYRLSYSATLTVSNAANEPLLAPIHLLQVRELTYAETFTLAKEAEENALKQGMEQEAVRQALRRLSYLKR